MLTITPIPALEDNYLWIITENTPDNQDAYIIDPGDGEAVYRYLQTNGLSLKAILITHRHPDHTGGIDFLTNQYAGTPVYGPLSPVIPQVTHIVKKDDTVQLFDRYAFKVIETPGHTHEHISYLYQQSDSLPLLFCGDTLFAGGCGRVFDKQPEKLYQSLLRFSELPDTTQVYCSHEYTLANLQFAKAVDPDNVQLNERIIEETKKRQSNIITLPTTIKKEKQTNPFLRAHQQVIQHAVEQHWNQTYNNPTEVFCQLRRWKDHF